MEQKIERYSVIKEIGGGAFGRVFAVRDPQGRIFAAKVISLGHQKHLTKLFAREAMMQMNLDHQSLLKAHRAFVRCRHLDLVIITDLCDQRCLADRLHSLSQEDMQSTMLGIASGISYLHNQESVIHRDIKPENILFKDGLSVIADFGLAKFAPQGAQSQSGTEKYMAPQMFTLNEYDKQVDVWALGIVFIEILLKKRITKLVKGRPCQLDPFPTGEIMNALPSQAACELMRMMFRRNPKERIQVHEVVEFLIENQL